VEALALDEAFEAELETELRMVQEAVLLVAAGAAQRVTVAGLRHGRVILEPAQAFAGDVGLRVEAVSTADPRRIDLAAARPALGTVGPPA
jgi:hypothetical protein